MHPGDAVTQKTKVSHRMIVRPFFLTTKSILLTHKMENLKSKALTTLTGLVIFLTVLVTVFNQAKWKDDNGVITGDVRGYYAYLPTLFIQGDIKLEKAAIYDPNKATHIWFSQAKDGTRFIKFTSGMSILYSPFFAAGHLYAQNSDYEANGFSTPYKVALTICGLFYLALSLIFSIKFLRLYYSQVVTSITILILFLGTNLFHYLTGSISYSHGYSFALIIIFMYATVKWLTKPSIKWSIIIGVTSGLMVLIRPVDLLFIFFIPLVHINSWNDLKSRFSLFWNKKTHVTLMLFVAFLMLLPQLIYFKYISGNFFFYSYDDESFFFLQPQFSDAFFSYRNGWLVYSPLMIFSILGLFLHRYKKPFNLYTVSIFLLYTYVIVSWWCWWYVGFGNRAFINLYPLLSIPLAGFIAWIGSKRGVFKILFGIVVFSGILLNIKQNTQFDKGLIDWGRMTKAAYWDSFGREKPSQIYETLLEDPVISEAMNRKNVVKYIFVDTISVRHFSFNDPIDCDTNQIQFFQPKGGRDHSGGLRIPKGTMYSLQHKIIPHENATHIYISTWVNNPFEIHLVVEGDNGFAFYDAASDISTIKNGWSKLQLNVKLPENIDGNQLRFYVWNKENHEFKYDDFSILQTKHITKQKTYN